MEEERRQFDGVQYGDDAHGKPVRIEVTPGHLILGRGGVRRWVVIGGYVVVGFAAAFWMSVIVSNSCEDHYASWKMFGVVLVFACLIGFAVEWKRRWALHGEYSAETCLAVSSVEIALTLGYIARSDAEKNGLAHIVENTGWIERALKLSREEREVILASVKEVGGEEAAEVTRQWRERGIETIEERMSYIAEHDVSKPARACLVLADEDGRLGLSPRAKLVKGVSDLVSLKFPTEQEARECAAIFNGREVEESQ